MLKIAISTLEEKGELPAHYQPHKLSGSYTGYWEAHLKSDVSLAWKVFPEENELWLTRTGTHADLF
jgi:mRNA interferase YafQ